MAAQRRPALLRHQADPSADERSGPPSTFLPVLRWSQLFMLLQVLCRSWPWCSCRPPRRTVNTGWSGCGCSWIACS